jgi:hypothetical protein
MGRAVGSRRGGAGDARRCGCDLQAQFIFSADGLIALRLQVIGRKNAKWQRAGAERNGTGGPSRVIVNKIATRRVLNDYALRPRDIVSTDERRRQFCGWAEANWQTRGSSRSCAQMTF